MGGGAEIEVCSGKREGFLVSTLLLRYTLRGTSSDVYGPWNGLMTRFVVVFVHICFRCLLIVTLFDLSPLLSSMQVINFFLKLVEETATSAGRKVFCHNTHFFQKLTGEGYCYKYVWVACAEVLSRFWQV